MTKGTWYAALTININGLDIDISELPESSRYQIVSQLLAGNTEGTLYLEDYPQPERAAC